MRTKKTWTIAMAISKSSATDAISENTVIEYASNTYAISIGMLMSINTQ